MQTTNDMPIVYPPSFKTLLPFDLNAHYLDMNIQSKHMDEKLAHELKEFMLITLFLSWIAKEVG
jgi:dipeptidase E